MDALTPLADTFAWLDLSAAQRAVWFDLQLDAVPLGYVLGGWARIDDDIDLDVAHQAVSLVMARHDALRLRVDAQLPRQRLDPSVLPPVTVTDLAHLADPERAFEAFAERAFATPLPLGEAPLFHVDLVRTGVSRWSVLWRCHHLIADATSVALALRHWIAAYDALIGEAGDLAPPCSFVSSLEADRAYQGSAQQDADIAYWRGRLDPPVELLFPRLPAAAALAAPVQWQLGGAAYGGFVAACRNNGVTTQRGVLALLAIVLAGLFGRRDLALGLALHRREFATRELVGMLAGVMPVRCAVDPGRSLADIMRAMATHLDQDFRHQRAPLDTLVRALAGRTGSARPLFDVVVSHLLDESVGVLSLGGGAMTSGAFRGPERTPLALYAVERPASGIAFEMSCNPHFVEPAMLCRIAEGFRRALAAFAADPSVVADVVDLLDPSETSRLLGEWSGAAATFPVASLPALFAEQVARTPHGSAVLDGERSLTYADLDAASDRLAAALQARGVGCESVVGVALPRSADTVIAFLAVLKAGGVYLPLDPAYPADRLAFMLHDGGAKLVITMPALRDQLPADVPQMDVGEGADGGLRPVALSMRQLAYIVYTSGSTGTPKGVAVSHAAAANLAFARRAGHDPIGPGDRILAAISVGFDVSIGQLLLPLFSGACVVIAPDLRELSAESFWALLARARVTHVNSVPSFFDTVLSAARPDTSLVRLMLGGEVLSGALVRKLRAALPGTDIVNMYGPTEATIDATAYPVPAECADGALPIGRPLANDRAYVLDARLRPCAPGVAGRLYLGGAGLARGYVGQPALTASRFVADPFGPPGGRLYDTGDLAAWREDGTLSFLGRADRQVKVRGHRVEPGEIEAALCRHPGVTQAAVVAREQALVAYVVAADGMPQAAALRAHLSASLPPHMVPTLYVGLKTLPLTRNGKLDRAALPAPEESGEADYVAPATARQVQVAEIFAALFGVARVGATDDFFALGGHSLLATRLVSQIRAVCGIDLPLRMVFESPTVASLAAAIDAASGAPSRPRLAAGEPGAEPVVSFAQERMWFLDQLTQTPIYVIPAALRLSGQLDAAALEAALQRIVARHETLRSRFEATDGRVGVVIDPPDFVLEQVDLTSDTAADAAVRRHIEAAEREPFVLASGRLFRARLLRLAPDQHVLVLAVHHIVADGGSIGVLLGEFAALYAAFLRGEPDPLPPLPIQYADFARWQRDWLTGDALEAQIAHWRAALAGAPEQIALPLDRPRPAQPSLRGGLVPWVCPPDLVARLQARARAADATPFMLLLTAFQALLARWSGVSDIVVGTPIAQRTEAATEQLIGLFINTIALRAQCAGRQSFAQILARGRETVLDALAHQDLPFEKLVDALRPQRESGRQPIVQVMFAMQDGLPAVALPGLRLQPVEMPVSVAKFDLTLSVMPGTGPQGGFCGGFEYATDLFDAATIERLAACFTRLLEHIAKNPDLSLDDIDLLAPAERARVLGEWSGVAETFPVAPLPALFAEQVARTPHGLAVLEGGRSLSYADLNAASDRLAAALQARGVGRESVVGVALPRSADTVIAFLAVLKAGGVYLPLDPAYPADRLAFMLMDAGAELVITSPAISDRLPAVVPQLDVAAGEDGTSQKVTLDLQQLAYIVYTSGSTGTPKGVAVSHAAAANLAFARCAGHDPIGPGDRILAAISVGFDVSIGQLLLPLFSGACVVIAPDLRELSAESFWALLARARVTHVNSVPSFFDTVLSAARPDTSLVRLMLGGEVLSGALVRKLRAALPGTDIVNMYGPTEATIDATAYPVPVACADGALPIGRPLANDRAYVLDARLRPCAPGVAGRLYLGGAGLARGYVGQPALTASRFVADPFGPPGGRLYDTGDLAAWREDGTLVFLGRVDRQIKVRGHRVEPGEIEAALCRHPGVTQAAVVAREQALVAYVVAADGMPQAAALRAHLSASLPPHMVPTLYVGLKTLPLTRNGKLDHAALPEPEAPVSCGRAPLPRNATEARLLEIWREVLGVSDIDMTDDFFDIGGTSLLAIRLVSACNAAFGITLPLADLFTSRSIEALAAAVRRTGTAAAGRLVTLRAGDPAEPPLFCVHPAGGMVFCYLPMVQHLPADLPVMGLYASGLEEGDTLAPSVAAMAADYVAALRKVRPYGPYRLAGWSTGGLVAIEMAHQLQAAGETVSFLCLMDTVVPAALAGQPATLAGRLQGALQRRPGLVRALLRLRILRPKLAQRLAQLMGPALDSDDVDAMTLIIRELVKKDLPPPHTPEAILEAAVANGMLPPGCSVAQALRVAGVRFNNRKITAAWLPPRGLALPVLQIHCTGGEMRAGDWAPLFAGPVETRTVPCGHEELVTAPFADRLAAAVIDAMTHLENADAR